MLKQGTNNSPPASDKSFTPPKGSVNDNPTRDSVAPSPRTLGPRTA